MHEAVAAIAKEGVSPLVRVAANEAWMVKRKFPLHCAQVSAP
jgi:4-hydroxy-2-oxoheptanedioate aldolase